MPGFAGLEVNIVDAQGNIITTFAPSVTPQTALANGGGSVTVNADGSITIVGLASGTTFTGAVTAPTFTGALAGNATTASTLATPRAINGVNFDGSAAITVAAAAGTLTGTTLAGNVVASSLTSVGILASPHATGLVVDSGGLTVTLGGIAVTGNSTITGTLTGLTGITSSGTISFTGSVASFVMNNGANIQVATSTGTQIATATTQKLGFFGKAPIAQPAASTNTNTPTAGSTTNVFVNTTFDGGLGGSAWTVGGLVAALKNLGLIQV